MSPSAFYKTLRKYWKRGYTIIFASVFLFGMAAHAYKFFNLLPNYDSLSSLYSSQNTIHLGRCFLTLGCGISSFHDLPWVIGLLSLFYLALSAVCIKELFGFTRPVCLILMSGILVVFPAVTNTFAFLFTADGYFLSMLLSSFAVLLLVKIVKSRKGILPAAVCFCLSLGMYQAYVLYAGVLVLLYAVKCMLFDTETVKSLFQRLLKILASVSIGAILYNVIYKLLLRWENVALSDMNGLSEISLGNLPNPFDAAYDAVHDFIFFFFYSEHGVTLYILLNILFVCGLLFLVLRLIYKKGRSLGFGRIALIVVAAAAVPFCIYFYYFISNVQYHTIMLESIALIYIFALLFLEHSESGGRFSNCCQWFLIILSSLIVYNFILTANIAYKDMAHSFERSTSVINRMAARMESLPGFSNAAKLAVIGELPGSKETIHNYPPDLSGTVPNYIMRIPENYADMLRNYNNIELEVISDEEMAALLDTSQYSQMTCWPENGSVAVIGDTVVLKLSAARPKGVE